VERFGELHGGEAGDVAQTDQPPLVGSQAAERIGQVDEADLIDLHRRWVRRLGRHGHEPTRAAKGLARLVGRDRQQPGSDARGVTELARVASKPRLDVEVGAEDLARIVYIDHYGNAMTGLRASAIDPAAAIGVSERRVGHARVFSAAPRGELFWYENSIGLVEIAANQASAAELLALAAGMEVTVRS